MNPLPDTVDLPTPHAKLGVFAFLGLVIVGAGLFAIKSNPTGWFLIATGVTFMALPLYGLIQGVGLSLDRQGFTVRGLFGERRYNWADVSAFEVRFAGRARQIRFNDGKRGPDMRDPFNKALRRGNSRISPIIVSGGLQNACDLLNAFRDRALKK